MYIHVNFSYINLYLISLRNSHAYALCIFKMGQISVPISFKIFCIVQRETHLMLFVIEAVCMPVMFLQTLSVKFSQLICFVCWRSLSVSLNLERINQRTQNFNLEYILFICHTTSPYPHKNLSESIKVCASVNFINACFTS